MVKDTGRNRNSNDEADTNSFLLNPTVAIIIQAANDDRMYFTVNNNAVGKGVWIRLYPAAQDNIKHGIYLSEKEKDGNFWEMPADNVYTGEISAIANEVGSTVYTTEY